MNRIGIGAALGLLVVVNALVLLGVARNRAGEPLSSLELTERELRLPWSREENTGLWLRLDWTLAVDRNPDEDRSDLPDWFGREKLQELGFDCSLPLDAPGAPERYWNALPRETYAVLEFEGESWENWLRDQETELEALRRDLETGDATREKVNRAEKSLQWARITQSRLFVVDVGNDPQQLRSEYRDRSRYMILPALVRLRTDTDWVDGEQVLKGIHGDVDDILVEPIHVPRSHRPILDALLVKGEEIPRFVRIPPATADEDDEIPPDPRFTVLLHVGRRHEPWIGAVRTWEPASDPLPR